MGYVTYKKLRISDVDLARNTKHSALMSVMQEAADEHAVRYGVNNDCMLRDGYAWVLTRMALKASRYIAQSAELRVETRALRAVGLEYPREYVLTDGEGREAAYGVGMWSVIDINTRRLTRACSISGYAEMSEDDAPRHEFKKVRLSLTEEFLPAGKHTVLNTEIDVLGHLNNIYYADMAFNALSRDEFASGFSEINVSYLREARLGEEIELYKHVTVGAAEIIGTLNGEKCFLAVLSR